MTYKTVNETVIELHTASQHLSDQARFGSRRAQHAAEQATLAARQLNAIDFEKAFRELRALVSLVKGTTQAGNVVNFPAKAGAQASAQAAE